LAATTKLHGLEVYPDLIPRFQFGRLQGRGRGDPTSVRLQRPSNRWGPTKALAHHQVPSA
jgi:hypothetical protein